MWPTIDENAVDIKGSENINMGEGDDTLRIDGSISENVTIDMGTGTDTLLFNLILPKSLLIKTWIQYPKITHTQDNYVK